MATPDQITMISTWSDLAHETYGNQWFDGMTTFWRPLGVSFRVPMEHTILEDPDVFTFREREADKQTSGNKLHRAAMKWSWKVFALTMEPMQTSGWMIWIDGDVEFTKTPTQEFLDAVCPDDADVSYLGRVWAYASETGFVAYNMASLGTRELLGRMRATYLTGAFRDLDSWTDGAVFDYCRKGLGLVANNLAAHCDGPDLHVWPKTILGEFMVHQKGPRRKAEAYGAPS
jgi:hypothetical protein